MIDLFNSTTFEAVLNRIGNITFQKTILGKEFVYILSVADYEYVNIYVASSINAVTDESYDVGENSIRCYIMSPDTKTPFGSKLSSYTTRVSGWENRMTKIIKDYIDLIQKTYKCEACKDYTKIFKSKTAANKNRMFLKCNCGKQFIWVDEFTTKQLEFNFEEQTMNNTTAPKYSCPSCNSALQLRTGKYGEFYGCTQFPQCKFTCNVNQVFQYEFVTENAPIVKKKFAPTKEQTDIYNWVRTNEGTGKHLIINAYAGSGKTYTIIESANHIKDKNGRVVFIAFNKHNKEDLRSKLPTGVESQTYHSFGYKLVRAMYKSVTIEQEYSKMLLMQQFDFESPIVRSIYHVASKIIGILKAMLLVTNEHLVNINDIIVEIMEAYDISFNPELQEDYVGMFYDLLYEMISFYFQRRFQTLYDENIIIDFDDMCWIPAINYLDNILTAAYTARMLYRVIYIDEAQDTNPCQIAMIQQIMKRNTSLIAVGDRHQAIYAFRGADSKAMDNIKQNFNAEELSLSVTFRCPAAVVELVRAKFPYIDIKTAPNALDGAIRSFEYEYALSEMVSGDMVLCRMNAPLVAPVLELLKLGKKAIIRGSDIGTNLITLLKRHAVDNDIVKTLNALESYRRTEFEKLMSMDKEQLAINLSDKIMTIVALADGHEYVSQVIDAINNVFSDDVEGILFSTVHKAKGLEAKSVYILKPELMPHPLAKRSNNGQEANIEYVALTRSLNHLTYLI